MNTLLRDNTAARWIFALLVIFAVAPASQTLLRKGLDRVYQRSWEQSRARLAQDLRTLDPVLHALEQYRLDHPVPATMGPPSHRYPATLQDLVPAYLPALPTLPGHLGPMRYELKQSLMPHQPPCAQIRLSLSPRSLWRLLLGLDPKGTLVYRGLDWSSLPFDKDPTLWGDPSERLAGWDFYPARPRSPFGSYRSPVPDPRQELLKPYRAARLQALQPVLTALDRFRADRLARRQYPVTPRRLEDLVPGYLKALPKLPPVFGPLHYEHDQQGEGWLWVVLTEQVTDPSGRPLDVSGGFSYASGGWSFDLLLDKADPNSRPLRRANCSIGEWAVYD